MKKLIAAALLAVVGCQPTVVTTQNTPTGRDNETDIKIRTPGAKVDINGKGDGKGVDIDIERKKNNP